MSSDDERRLLLAQLAAQRRHVLGIVDGLPEDALRRAVLPSGWTCAGLVQHLALDVERFWFGAVAGGDPATIAALDHTIDAWTLDEGVTAASVLDTYRSVVESADRIIAATELDAPPRWWPEEQFGDWRMESLRQIILHVVVETACHTGHLDAARELIDQRQWFVID